MTANLPLDLEISYADDIAPAPVPTVEQIRALQDVQRIDTTGAARAAADETIARSLGFSPAPPVYALGTVVNSTGVDNFKASRADWARLPSLPEAARTFTKRIADEHRSDSIVNARDLTMLPTGELRHIDSDNVLHSVTERAMLGIASHVTPGGANYLSACPASLRAANLNHWLQTATQRQTKSAIAKGTAPKAKQLTLRTRNRGEGREVYAVTGPKYAAFNVDQVVREAAAGIGGDARCSVIYDGFKLTMDALFHSNIAPENAVAGEFFKGCIRVQSADDGSGSVNVKLGLWRNLCRNLIIVDFNTVLIGSRRHVGSTTIEADVRELMESANERIALIVSKWSEASIENVLERYDLQDVDQVFRGLVVNDCVKASGVTADQMVDRLHAAWLREPGYSKTAILNAITRAAHEESWSSWSAQEDLESAAGELLYQPVWNLDISDRTAEEILA